ncbi:MULTISPECIES: SIS domain-containing protein [Asaia]|uniref:SIS domain-containing protein n=1 Tax=Asaia spathodeae TaxID=657016 RepID=A0ABX2P0T6_9PROT|nr:SIS domain-containing protein [Asaia spathodeae]
MNATERGIREQFSFWRALTRPQSSPQKGQMHAIIGCGTSVHIADSIACALNEAGFLARAVPGNEWTRRASSYVPSGTKTQLVALSRSGESTETVAAAAAGLEAGHEVLGVTCAAGSALTKMSSEVFEAETHPEEGIVMTASASLMLLAGLRYAGRMIGPASIAAAEALLEEADTHLVALLRGRSHFVFLGGGALYGVAREGALKMQEMSLSQSEAHHPLEYRHGPISLIDERSFVVMLYHPDTREEEALVARDVMEKGAVVLGLGGPGTVSLPVEGDHGAEPLICLPVLQLLGEYVARAHGLDTLAPRHLTKVVTLKG